MWSFTGGVVERGRRDENNYDLSIPAETRENLLELGPSSVDGDSKKKVQHL